jgi:hypothetical protein
MLWRKPADGAERVAGRVAFGNHELALTAPKVNGRIPAADF